MRSFKFCLFVVLLIVPLTWAQNEARNLASANWGVRAEPTVVDRAFSSEAARDLVRALSLAFIGDKTFLGPDIFEVGINDLGWKEVIEDYRIPGALGKVGALKWTDVDADGMYELLVTMDYSGRAFYNNFFVIKQIAGGYRYQSVFIWNAETFAVSSDELLPGRRYYDFLDKGCSVIIADLNQDGMLELILPILLGHYRGASPMPIWPGIYKWEEYGYMQADDQFSGVYEKNLLPGIDEIITVLSSDKNIAEPDLDERLAAEWVIKDKIIRLLGIDSQAGLQRAIRWSQSANRNLRENAAITLIDIPGDDATRYLNEMNLDSLLIEIIKSTASRKRRE